MSYFRLNIWWDVIYVQREQQGTKNVALGDTRQNRSPVRFYSIHNNSLFSEAKKRIYPFQCLATNSIAKQFAFKEFMRGCIKFVFKSQYECVNLSSVVQDFSPIIYYSSQLFHNCVLSCLHVAYLTGVYIHQDEPWYLNILCVWVTCKVHKSRKPGDNCTQVTCHSSVPLSELENDSESVWVKVFANKTSYYVASWYRPPGGSSEDFHLFGDQLDQIRNKHTGNKLPSVHVLGDFNFKDIAWPDRLNKSGSMLSQSEGQMLIDIMNDHSLEQLVHFPTREKNTLDLIHFLVNFKKYIPQTNLVTMMSSQDLWKFTFPRKRNLGGKCIYITKEILSRWGKMRLTLQKIGTSMVTRIIARFRKTLIWQLPLFKSLLISMSPLKPVVSIFGT